MTTYYQQVPTLEERVTAVSLIVTGTVGKVVGTQIDYYDHEPFVRTTYEVAVQKVLKGALKQKIIHIEVMGGESDKAATPLRVPLDEGTPVVLMLVPQAGADALVPYFSSVFPLKSNDRIALVSHTAEELSSQAMPIKGRSISLDTLRALIKTVTTSESAKTEAAESAIAGRALPPVSELPRGFDSGGEPSAPEVSEQPEKPN